MDAWHFAAPFVGGVALEAVYWYELREKLTATKYRKMLRSLSYWLPTVAMILAGAAVALFWAASKSKDPTSFELLVAGAAAPSLLKNAVTALLAREKTKLGGDEADDSVKVRDYFVPGP